MSDPFAGHRTIWLWQFQSQAEQTVTAAAQTARGYADADVLLLKAADGRDFMSTFDPQGVQSRADLLERIAEGAAAGVAVVPWLVVTDPAQADWHATAVEHLPCVVDIELGPGFLSDATGLGRYLQTLQQTATHVGLSYDPRPGALNPDSNPNFSIAQSLHPQCYWPDFASTPEVTAEETLPDLTRPGSIPIYPVLPATAQAGELARFWGTAEARVCWSGPTACSLWRMGTASAQTLEDFRRLKVGGK